jgi:hypothetical protein
LVLELQRSAGNRATAGLVLAGAKTSEAHGPQLSVQRDPPDATAAQAAPNLPPEVRRQLLLATTTLRRVEALTPANQVVISHAISGAPLYEHLQQRNLKRTELAARRSDLMRATPLAGVPSAESEEGRRIAELNTDIARLTTEINSLDSQVQSGLRAAGCASEDDLVRLLTVDFPRQFIERGKQIAIAQLDENRELAQHELERYSAGVNHAPDRDGIRHAATDLRDRQRTLAALEEQKRTALSAIEPLPGGVPDPATMSSSEYDVRHLNERISELTTSFQQQRDVYRVQYPILMRFEDYDGLASADDTRLAQLTSSPAQTIIANIDATKANVRSGQLKVWNLHDIVDTTVMELGIAGNETLMRVVQEHISSEQSDEAMIRLGVGALALTAAIIATVATGGLALAAAGVALSAGTYQAIQSGLAFGAETAASNVALDPRVADISRNEPELLWLILDIAFVALDAAQLIRVFNEMRLVAHALRDTGDLGEFARAARAAMPQAAADRVIASASRYAATLPARTGGRAGISLDWIGKTNPATGRVFSMGPRLAEEIEPLRQALLSTQDVGRVTSDLQRLGVSVDRSIVGSIKQYNFNSPGIQMSYQNYSAWRRLATGQGQVRDAQYIVHEAAEVAELRAVRSRTGLDFMGGGLDTATGTEKARWAADFDRAYLAAHRRAVEAEYDFVAQQVSAMTNGRVTIPRNLAAVADSLGPAGVRRSEGVDHMLVDGVLLRDHSSFAQLSQRAAATVEIGRSLQTQLRLGPRPTLAELVGAIRRSPGR